MKRKTGTATLAADFADTALSVQETSNSCVRWGTGGGSIFFCWVLEKLNKIVTYRRQEALALRGKRDRSLWALKQFLQGNLCLKL